MFTSFVFENLKDVNIKGVKVKVKFILEEATKVQGRRRGITILFP
jgi:hypothetical protein